MRLIGTRYVTDSLRGSLPIHTSSGVSAYLIACELATLAQKGASQALARLAFFRVPSHDIA